MSLTESVITYGVIGGKANLRSPPGTNAFPSAMGTIARNFLVANNWTITDSSRQQSYP